MFRSLNALKFNDENIVLIKNYLQTGQLPNKFNDLEKTRFRNNFKEFVIEDNQLVYRPKNLIVVPKAEIQKTLEDLYKDPVYGIGTGIKSFYSSIVSKYLNITRKEVTDFLNNKTTYQLTKKEPRPTNKPVFATYANQRWASDLVDIKLYEGYNQGYKFILTAIDFFSKKVFATGIFDNTAPNVIQGFNRIVDEQANGTTPNYLQTDNGPEFTSDLFKQWCEDKNIKLIHTLSYTPQSNGLIENFNGQLRKMMREGFIRYKDEGLNWRNHLDEYLENKNLRKHTTTKEPPNNVWREGSTINKENDNDVSREVRQRIKDNIKRQVAKNKSEILHKGDKVRVLMSSLYSEIRALVKSGREKLIPVKWSPNIYTVKKRERKPHGIDPDFYKPSYTLYDQNGDLVLSQIKLNNPNRVRGAKKFFATELQKIDTDKVENVITQKQANKINKIGIVELEDEKVKSEEEKKIKKPKVKEPIEMREKSKRERKARDILDL